MEEGRLLYSLGRHSFEKIAKDSGARREAGGRVLVNVLNKYVWLMKKRGRTTEGFSFFVKIHYESNEWFYHFFYLHYGFIS